MRIRKLAIAALIAGVPTADAFSQNALDQSVPHVSPTNEPRVSPTNEPHLSPTNEPHVSPTTPLPTNPAAIPGPTVIVPPAPAGPDAVDPNGVIARPAAR
jgi:hypothetical protein